MKIKKKLKKTVSVVEEFQESGQSTSREHRERERKLSGITELLINGWMERQLTCFNSAAPTWKEKKEQLKLNWW